MSTTTNSARSGAAVLLARLRELGAELTVAGDRLRYDAPNGVITDAVIGEIRRHRGDLIELLDSERLVHAPSKDGVPLSYAQEGLWVAEQLHAAASHVMRSAHRVRGPLDADALRRAVETTVGRHEVLRTTIEVENGEPRQRIHAEGAGVFTVEAAAGADDPQIERIVDREHGRRFDVGRGPLFRVHLVRVAPEEHVLVFTVHHLIGDAWTLGLVVHEITALYAANLRSAPSPLPAPEFQYADYTRWERRYFAGPRKELEEDYWRTKLSDAPREIVLPADRARPATPSYRGGAVRFLVPLDLTRKLVALGAQHGASPYMVMYAVWTAFLARYSGQRDLVIGSSVAGRSRPEFDGIAGLFANMVALRLAVSDAEPFSVHLRRARDEALETFAHQNYPLSRVVDAQKAEHAADRQNPLFNVSLIMQNAVRITDVVEGTTVTPLELTREIALLDLVVEVAETAAGFEVALLYACELFAEASVQRMSTALLAMFGQIVREPETAIGKLTLFDSAELELVLRGWNATTKPTAKLRTLQERFSGVAASSPGSLAITHGARQVTYGELDERTTRLARRLIALGVRTDSIVVVLAKRSVELLVGILGVLKAGAAYVVLDPTQPPERLVSLLEDCGARVVLSAGKANAASSAHYEVLELAEDAPEAQAALDVLTPATAPNAAAYVVYTSGSTGKPKGVVVTHACASNFVEWLVDRYSLSSSDVVLHRFDAAFDASVMEIFGALCSGAHLVIAEPGREADSEYLDELLRREGVTVWSLTPAQLRAMVDGGGLVGGATVRLLLCGGEVLNPELLSRVPCRVANQYGPTETTVVATDWMGEVADVIEAGRVPIGRPITNVRVYVLDATLRPVPLGGHGELFIGGAQVARGYLDRPELTAERFVPDPFSDVPGARLYRTGDVVRWSADGQLEFAGRVDRQVKLRGYRIELGEIESALLAVGGVREAIVVVLEAESAAARLVACVAPERGQALSEDSLKEALRRVLPGHMVPPTIHVVEALPRLSSGKLDMKEVKRLSAGVELGVAKPARGRLAMELAEAWKDLGVDDTGSDKDFFALGGNSLLVVQLRAGIKRRLGVEVAMADLYRCTTVGKQVELLATSVTRRTSDCSLVPFNEKGTRTPVFLVHELSGVSTPQAALARSLGPKRPVYVIEARGLLDGHEPIGDMETMATTYLALLRSQRPKGPYLLGGWSFGGLVAIEMAARLESEGESCAVALLDVYLPAEGTTPTEASLPAEALSDQYAAELGLPGAPRVVRANMGILREYALPSFGGRTLLVHASEHPGGGEIEASAHGLQRHLSNLEVRPFPASHFTMMRYPTCGELARLIEELVSSFEANPSSAGTR